MAQNFAKSPEQIAEEERLAQERNAAQAKLAGSSAVGFDRMANAVDLNTAQKALTYDPGQNEQTRRAGVDSVDTETSTGGIGGFFGAKEKTKQYTAGAVQDTTTAGSQQALAQRIQGVDGRPMQTMQGAQLAPAAQMQAANMGAGATIATAPQDQFRNQQMSLAQQLGASAAGQGPSAAQDQLKLATDRNMSGALALALGARGGNQAGAMKQAQMQRGLISQEAAGQSGMLRAQEMQAAQQSLGQVLGAGRGADIGMATDQAGLAQQAAQTNAGFTQAANAANLGATQETALAQGQLTQGTSAANLQAGVQQQQQKDELVKQYLAMGMSMDQAAMQADIQQKQFNAKLLVDQEGIKKGLAASSAQAGGQVIGGAMSALGAIGAKAISDRREKTNVRSGRRALGELLSAGASSLSDEREKTEIRPAKKALGELLSGVGSHEYEYKDPDKPLRGRGRFVSPMAQEIEETEIGRSMVKTGPDGTKIVDYGKGLGAMLSGLGWLHERMGKLEEHHPLGARLAGAMA